LQEGERWDRRWRDDRSSGASRETAMTETNATMKTMRQRWRWCRQGGGGGINTAQQQSTGRSARA
jgi:hypothetical protein